MRNDVYIVVLVYYHDCWGVRGLFTSSHIKIPVQGGGEYSALHCRAVLCLGPLVMTVYGIPTCIGDLISKQINFHSFASPLLFSKNEFML